MMIDYWIPPPAGFSRFAYNDIKSMLALKSFTAIINHVVDRTSLIRQYSLEGYLEYNYYGGKYDRLSR